MFNSFKELHKFLNWFVRQIANEMDNTILALNQDPKLGSVRDFEACFGIVPIKEINYFLLKFKMILSSKNIIEVGHFYPTKRHLINGFFNEFKIDVFPNQLLPKGILISNSLHDNVNIFIQYINYTLD